MSTNLLTQDSRVRFSAAKGIARIAAEVSEEMRTQIVEALLEQLVEHVCTDDIPTEVLSSTPSSSFKGSYVQSLDKLDLYAVSDSTWHGVFLAIAECMRRAQIPRLLLSRILYWTQRGLLFDVPRGAGAAGSNIRDACCYVVWALARIRQTDTLAPYVLSIAQRLSLVTTLDRETTIRRAASAAFQEWVGRTTLVPHGISILKETDFAAVGRRRHAYTVCAPRIAQYKEYREPLLLHLQQVCLRHWDANVRMLAASAIKEIAPIDRKCIVDILQKQVQMASTSDINAVHGALLALAAICPLMNDTNEAHVALNAALQVSPRLFSSPGGAMILDAACRVVAAAAPLAQGESLSLLQIAATRPESEVHDAVAAAIGALGESATTDAFVRHVLEQWSSCTPEEQRSGALVLGRVRGRWTSECRKQLCGAVQGLGGVDVETRRNAALALAGLANGTPDEIEDVIFALVQGLQDHSTDERGDVGSWVRAQCIVSLSSALQSADVLIHLTSICKALSACLAERIDSLRATACVTFRDLAATYPIPAKEAVWTVLNEPESTFRDARSAFACIVPLLGEDVYRPALLPTLTRTIASRSESAVRLFLTQLRDAGRALVDWMHTADQAAVNAVYGDLGSFASRNVRDNRVFVPILQTVQHLLEWEVVPSKTEWCAVFSRSLVRLVRLASSHIATLKSMPRLMASMHMYVAI